MFFVYWTDLRTGYCSHGKCIFLQENEVKKFVNKMNEKHKNIILHKYSSSSNYNDITTNLAGNF